MSRFKKGDLVGYSRYGCNWVYVVVVLSVEETTEDLESYKVFALLRPDDPPGIIYSFTYRFFCSEDYELIAHGFS